ncbi:MAG: hypothetical protein HY617_02180 [Candidatus Sungbacteria bacterium]|nr:hypothetical protein [Candidatus Sungbacteria bacterium]
MDILSQIATRIIREQELIIGPLAWSEAGKVRDIRIVDQKTGEVAVEGIGDHKLVIDALVARYERLFGRASIEVCKEAAAAIVADLKPEDVPESLR